MAPNGSCAVETLVHSSLAIRSPRIRTCMKALGVIILAAGASSRMGQPKLLLPWRGSTVIGHSYPNGASWACGQIAVVLRPDDTALHAELDRLDFPMHDRIVNPHPDHGMFSSIVAPPGGQAGAATSCPAGPIVLGDQPHLRRDLASASDISPPESRCRLPAGVCGRAAHPVVLPQPALRVCKTSSANTLKEFLKLARCRHASKHLINDPGLSLDLDTPEDYIKPRISSDRMKKPERESLGAHSRRTFLKSLGTVAATAAAAQVKSVAAELEKANAEKVIGPGAVPVTLKVNGKICSKLMLEPRVTLLDALRNYSSLTGAKEGCDRAACGACTVLVDGVPIYSCQKLAIEAQGCEITTVEGLAKTENSRRCNRRLSKRTPCMCGYCTPGFVMSVTALLQMESASNGRGRQARLRRQPLPLRHASAHSCRRSFRRPAWPAKQNGGVDYV
jgi:xanthine dehydrogenase YagT iron-sulfur-binding subunit